MVHNSLIYIQSFKSQQYLFLWAWGQQTQGPPWALHSYATGRTVRKQIHRVEPRMEYYWELRSKNAQNIKALMCPLYKNRGGSSRRAAGLQPSLKNVRQKILPNGQTRLKFGFSYENFTTQSFSVLPTPFRLNVS